MAVEVADRYSPLREQVEGHEAPSGDLSAAVAQRHDSLDHLLQRLDLVGSQRAADESVGPFAQHGGARLHTVGPDAGAVELGAESVRDPVQRCLGGAVDGDRRARDPELERRLASADWSLQGVNPRVLEADPRLLANANTPAELSALEQDLAALGHDQA